jgi:hypothetical protein
MEEKDVERIASLESKMDMLIQMVNKVDTTLSTLSTTYVTRAEFNDFKESVKERLNKQESAPKQWIPILIAGAALLLQFIRS